MSLFPTTTSISSIASVFTTGTPYLALFTATPNAGGGGTEVTGGSYVRKAITFGSVSGGAVSNSAAITFTGLPAGTITHYAVMSAATSGTMRAFGPLNASAISANGDELHFAIGTVSITITGS